MADSEESAVEEGAEAEKSADSAPDSEAAAAENGADATAKEDGGDAGAAEEAASSDDNLDPSTHFAFQHKIFKVPGARFSLSGPDRIPALLVNVGEHEASVPIDSLCNEFKIDPESQDGKMLNQVSKGLRFVKDIRPGDTIPRELLDGTASWSIEDHHGVFAKNKFMMDIANWASGKGRTKMSASELASAVDKAQTKTLIEQGLDKLTEALGKDRTALAEVQDLIDRLVRELAYIEALRERYAHASEIRNKLTQVVNLNSSDRHFVDEIQRVKVLIGPPIKDFSQIFDQVDTQMADVVNTLKTFNKKIVFIREMRDELHQKMLIWDEAIEHWDIDLSHKSKASREAVQFTYRFVAYNFPQKQDWF